MKGPPEIVVLGRKDCHLCELVEAEIRSMEGADARLTVVDIDKDAALQGKYWLRIPVVLLGGREVFEAKMMDPEGRWRRALPSLLMSS